MGLEKNSSRMDPPIKVSVSMVTFNSSFELLKKPWIAWTLL